MTDHHASATAALPRKPVRLGRPSPQAGEINMVAKQVAQLTELVLDGIPLSRNQADWIVENVREKDLQCLLDGAARIRDKFIGTDVSTCSIVAGKVGRCDQDCSFCSQSAYFKTHVKGETVLSGDQVYQASREAAANGASCFCVVNSGLGPTDEEIEQWAPVFERIREPGDIGLGASLGVLTPEQVRRLGELGVRRYNHNLQTSRRFFPNIITTHGYDERLETLRLLKQAGIELCSGALFGMGENWSDRLDLAFELRDLAPEVIPINFLMPIDGTPLARTPPLGPTECLKIIAVFRYLLPKAQIEIAGGRNTQLGTMQDRIFAAGASGFLMGNYLTTCGRSPEEDQRMVRQLGLQIAPFKPDPDRPESIRNTAPTTPTASSRCPDHAPA